MAKKVIKEFIILLILIAAILLILTVLFYDSIPMNKVVPSKVTYTLPENMQSELDKTLEEEKEVIITYTIDEKQLDIYQRNDSYDPGKVDPFASYQKGENTNNNNNNNNNSNTADGGSTNGNTTAGNNNTTGDNKYNSVTNK